MTKFTSFFAKETISKLSVLFLIVGVSFLFPSTAHANMGLQAYFYDNQTGQDNLYNNAPPIPPITSLVASIPVATVDQDFDQYPLAGVPYDDFVVKYEGYLTATESATVNLQCLADDGCIVIIDGVTVIDEWWDKGTDGGVYQYTLVPNVSLPFTVWYYENGGGAVIQLRWQFPDRDWEVVPEAVYSTVPKVTPIPVVSPNPETQTVVAETVTASSGETSTVVDSSTVVTESSTSSADSETVVTQPQESQTVSSETTTTTETQTANVTPEPPIIPEPTPIVVPEPPIVRPEPVVIPDPPAPLPEPTPEPTPEPEPEPEPVPEVEPEPVPEPEIPVVEPEPEVIPEPAPEPPIEEEPEPLEVEPVEEVEQPEPPVVEEVEEVEEVNPTPELVVLTADTDLSELAPETPVQLENGVILTAEVVVALQLLENPAELLAELFSNPAEVLTALSNIGADMSPEVRERSEDVVVAAVIVGNIATQAAATAAGVAAYRRKP